MSRVHGRRRAAIPYGAAAGALGALATVSFLVATGRGDLSVVAVLTALYPAVTIVLARLVISERWSRSQGLGLLAAAASVVLISIGSGAPKGG
jgi:drug/metabolite transporter (DMT)-like permease